MAAGTETSLGDLFYWAASMLAGLIVVLVAINYLYNISLGVPAIPVVALMVAGIIWLIGRSCRAVCDDR